MRESGADMNVAKINQVSRRLAAGEIPVALRAPSISPGPKPQSQNSKPKRGHFYFGKNRTFLFWLDTSKFFS
jgi:hypothetical protein